MTSPINRGSGKGGRGASSVPWMEEAGGRKKSGVRSQKSEVDKEKSTKKLSKKSKKSKKKLRGMSLQGSVKWLSAVMKSVARTGGARGFRLHASGGTTVVGGIVGGIVVGHGFRRKTSVGFEL